MIREETGWEHEQIKNLEMRVTHVGDKGEDRIGKELFDHEIYRDK